MGFPRSCLLSVYYTFVYQFLTFDIEFWGQPAEWRLHPLRDAQKSYVE